MRYRVIKIILKHELKKLLFNPEFYIIKFLIPFILFYLCGNFFAASIGCSSFSHCAGLVSNYTPTRAVIINQRNAPFLVNYFEYNNIQLKSLPDPYESLKNGEIDYIIKLPDDYYESSLCKKTFDIIVSSRVKNYVDLLTQVMNFDIVSYLLEEYNKELRDGRLNVIKKAEFSSPVPRDFSLPLLFPTELKFNCFLQLVLLFILAMDFIPVIEVICDEKEQETLEPLLMAPIKNVEIFMSKFLACLLVNVFPALFHIIISFPLSIGSHFYYFFNYWHIIILPMMLAVIFLSIMSIPLYMLIGLFITSRAKAIPVMLYVLMGIILAFFLEQFLYSGLNYILSPIPFLNIFVFISTLFTFDNIIASCQYLFVAGLFSILFAFLVLKINIRIFENTETILKDIENSSLFPLGDRPPGNYPALLEITLFITVVFLIFFNTSIALAPTSLILSVYFSQIICLLIPSVFYLSLWKYSIREFLLIRRPTNKCLIISPVFALSCFFLIVLLYSFQEKIFPSASPEVIFGKEFLEQLTSIKTVGDFFLKVGMISILPALCEESLFRGLLQTSLIKRIGPFKAIILSSLVFAFFHMSIYRLLPTFLLGLALGYLAYTTRSIFPCMIVHAINNIMAVLLKEQDKIINPLIIIPSVLCLFIIISYLNKINTKDTVGKIYGKLNFKKIWAALLTGAIIFCGIYYYYHSDQPIPEENLSETERLYRAIKVLEKGNKIAKLEAAWELGELRDDRGLEPLIKSLKDEYPWVRINSAWALGKLKDHRSIDPLLKSLKDVNTNEAARALGELGYSEALFPLIVKTNSDGSSYWSLDELMKKPQNVELFIEKVKKKEIDGPYICEALGTINDIRVYGMLKEKFMRGDNTTRFAASRILSYMGDKDAISFLEGLLSEADSQRVISVINTLVKTGSSEFERLLINAIKKHKEPEVRLTMARALASIGNEKTVNLAIEHLQGQDWNALAIILEEFGDERNIPLIKLLKDDNPQIRAFAVHLLGETGDASVVGELKKATLNETSKEVLNELRRVIKKLDTY